MEILRSRKIDRMRYYNCVIFLWGKSFNELKINPWKVSNLCFKMLFSWNLMFLLKSYLANWLEISDLKFILSREMLQDVCAETWSRNYLDLLCQESISSCWDPAVALVSLPVVSQSLFHPQESSGGEVCMKENKFYFLLLLHRAFLSVCGVCVCERRGWDVRILDWKQRVAKRFVLTCLWHCFLLVRNKSYLCHAFTCVLGITFS